MWSLPFWYPEPTRPATQPPRLPGTIALVPVNQDAYTLPFCVRSFAPVVDNVVLCLDAPDAATEAVIATLAAEFGNVSISRPTDGRQDGPAGWAATRNRAIQAGRERFPEARHVLMVDADDVLAWGHVESVLEPLFRNERVLHARLGICELVGDWITTARGRTLVHDQNHVYWRARETDVHFTTDPDEFERIHVVERRTGREVPSAASRQILFHGILVKSGAQLLRRMFTRPWLLAGRPEPLDRFIVGRATRRFPRGLPDGLTPGEFIVFNDPRRRRLTPLREWQRRLPPPVLEHQLSGPRFTMDLAARRRSDREPPEELERAFEQALATHAAGSKGVVAP